MAVTTVTLQPDGQLVTETEPIAAPADQTAVANVESASTPAPDPETPAAPSPGETERDAEPAPAPETESTGEDEEGEPESVSSARRQPSSVDRAMARLRREASDARERAAAAEERARLYEAGRVQPLPPDARPEPPARTGPPRLEEYASDAEYNEAYITYQVDQRFQERERQQREVQARQAQGDRERALEARQDAFRAQHQDYDDVLANRLTGRMSPQLFAHLLEDDDGPALAYHILARDAAALERLNQMDERQMARALGRLAARLPSSGNGTSSSSTPSVINPKPTPLTPVSGAGAGAPTSWNDDMDQRTFDKMFPYRPGRR